MGLFDFFKSKAKVSIELEKDIFAPGDLIRGKVIVEVRKDIKTKDLAVYLVKLGEKRRNGAGKSTDVLRFQNRETRPRRRASLR